MIVAVDAAGGDYYPQNPVAGALLALQENDELTVLLIGPEAIINKELATHEYDKNRVLVYNAPEIIGMEESPSTAVKAKKNSSIVIGNSLIKVGKCQAFVSAGNTGALLAASTFILGKLEGVIRPTIGALYPTVKGFRLLVDAGANLEIKPEMAIQFAKMGKIFCREVLGIDSPKVGLLNVGEEEGKGTETLKEIYPALQASVSNFIGNVEGKDIMHGKADVFVCDGLVGNLILKFGESIPEILMMLIGKTIREANISQEDALKIQQVIASATASFNYENVGGIPFLGVNGVSLVGHGSSTPKAIKNMIHKAIQTYTQDVNGKIIASLN